MESSYSKSTKEVLDYFETDARTGLTKEQIEKQRKKHGRNALPKDPPTPLHVLVLEQFKDQLVVILLLAALISFVLAFFEESSRMISEEGLESSIGGMMAAFIEPIVILLILVANATVGVVQETNAEKAIEALKSYAPDEAKVLRDGHVHKVASEDLVPGDIVEVSVGDKTPADLRLLEIKSSTLRIDQAILTGESVSVRKSVDAIGDERAGEGRAVKQDQLNMLFSGTTVTYGHALAIVVQTGRHTAIGEIQKHISEAGLEKTPLKKRLDDFGDSLAKVITVICILVWLINIQHFNDPAHGGWLKGAVYYFKIAVALAVAAIPEGLAVIITTCLALGTRRMATKNAIVRSLPSVETLGCTSVICSDKTGTLTTNRMTVTRFVVVNSVQGALDEYSARGTDYAPAGSIHRQRSGKEGVSEEETALQNPVSGLSLLAELVNVCVLCNGTSIVWDESKATNGSSSAGFTCVGEPTEAALKVLAEKLRTADPTFNDTLAGLRPAERASAVSDYIASQWEIVAMLDFDRDRKSMSVVARALQDHSERPAGFMGTVKAPRTEQHRMFIKGAPENILERCTHVRLSSSPGAAAVLLNGTIRAALLEQTKKYGEKDALRVLGLAVIDRPPALATLDLSRPESFVTIEQGMTFVGLVAMTDPPRPEVKASIQKCTTAGIRVVVITGDNQATAESICRQIGLFAPGEDLHPAPGCGPVLSLTGRAFDALGAKAQLEVAQTALLFSRTDPIHKSRLVDLLKSTGAIVAMTGDGVNDAPALKKADIGIAMGSGTDVAKLAADMVLADDDFGTIVAAVEEGRSIYANTKQFIRYLISSNIGEVVAIFLTVLLGLPEALIPVQLLWVNLVTDGLPATALGFNPPDHQIMKVGPRDAAEPIVTRPLFLRYCIVGGYVGIATVLGYVWFYLYAPAGPAVSWFELSHFHTSSRPGLYAPSSIYARKATSVSLSVLVTIEMLNALNSLSENESLLTLPPWKNLYLLAAIALSMALHFSILYIPVLSTLFALVALDATEWLAVVALSLPVILIDEILKAIARTKASSKKSDERKLQ